MSLIIYSSIFTNSRTVPDNKREGKWISFYFLSQRIESLMHFGFRSSAANNVFDPHFHPVVLGTHLFCPPL